ncbi:hypothetical protein V8C86DRAFT_3133102 [Haematococcus lacustris]
MLIKAPSAQINTSTSAQMPSSAAVHMKATQRHREGSKVTAKESRLFHYSTICVISA